MATTHEDAIWPFGTDWAWRGGAIAGLGATVVMGIAIMAIDLAVLQEAIASLYGMQGNLVAGWIAHLVHGALFGALFALVLSDPGLHRLTEWRWKALVAGVVFALMLAVFGAGIIMPIWLRVAGFPTPPPIPNVTTPLLLWHLVYGIVLGALFPTVEGV
ncbi:histidine kinase [Halorubrum sp. BOL3-1]|uniref:histidine kinase n=1 Tax=Halorubrum sp. BOL3-1 TaxID=2497325 RepID=UPI0010050FC7|nr:histidine kinase [Halorubrum sp. BOL3-1]QAU11453.1 histidine kinase [Halorubrum sp. BOL3-1]